MTESSSAAPRPPLWTLAAAMAGCLVLGMLSGTLSGSGDTPWYRALVKGSLTPPNWVFPVAWTILYLLIGAAAWRVWRRGDRPGARLALGLFALQLVLNLAWSPMFFGLESVTLGAVTIVPVLLAAGAAMIAFRRVDPAAAAMLAPYVLWLVYATAVAWQIWRLNG
ncbi:TspO/MBR family protein [Inquilinus sp.]|jgi:benzodiazapine receptor|uniref:TspO/MBR family protein n=1 Tax=Inquilinus sp. TaxID=1932117 RepID=UPI0037830686